MMASRYSVPDTRHSWLLVVGLTLVKGIVSTNANTAQLVAAKEMNCDLQPVGGRSAHHHVKHSFTVDRRKFSRMIVVTRFDLSGTADRQPVAEEQQRHATGLEIGRRAARSRRELYHVASRLPYTCTSGRQKHASSSAQYAGLEMARSSAIMRLPGRTGPAGLGDDESRRAEVSRGMQRRRRGSRCNPTRLSGLERQAMEAKAAALRE
jgi:hypothetical protein